MMYKLELTTDDTTHAFEFSTLDAALTAIKMVMVTQDSNAVVKLWKEE